MSSPFDIVTDISFKKEYIYDEEADYVPFLTNRAFSYFPDTIFYANEMNRHAAIPSKMQHDFYFYAIPKKKRFSKWAKAPKHEDLALLMDVYKYSIDKAKQVLPLFSAEQLQELRDSTIQGGVINNNGRHL